MELLKPSAEGISRAVEVLRGGGVVAFPTDTVYGLAALTSDGVERVYALKGRERGKPLVLMGADWEALSGRVKAGEGALGLIRGFWPGPLTLVLEGQAGGASVGVRVPDHSVALELLRASGPLWTTSANRSGEADAMSADEVGLRLPGVDAVIDGGRAPGGTPSTVVDASGDAPKILRAGAIAPDQLNWT